jgi:enoyl-[acyl-carrier protein] reductase II
METRITRLLGIEKPIIQGAMAWIADASLAAAVSEAGGLGIIACGSAPLSWVEEQVKIARSKTSKPLGANIMLMNPEAPELARLLVDLKIEVITTGAGSPAPYIDMWKEAGIKVIPVVASSAHAKKMERAGADAVVAEGQEAGGHIGQISTMTLTPTICDAVSIPVITAGGVADGRGMCAAFALGAEGVQIGTRFLTAHECTVAPEYKAKIMAAKDSDTIVTGRDSGHPVRQLKNRFSREAHAAEKNARMGIEADVELKLAGSLARAVHGDVVTGSIMSGEVASLVNDEKSAAQIIDDLMAEAEALGALKLAELAAHNATHTHIPFGEGE